MDLGLSCCADECIGSSLPNPPFWPVPPLPAYHYCLGSAVRVRWAPADDKAAMHGALCQHHLLFMVSMRREARPPAMDELIVA